MEAVTTQLRLRVVNRLTAAEITPDLPHVGSIWNDVAMQPGASGAVGVGDFTIFLPLPGSEEFKDNYDLYNSLTPFAHRIEAYETSAAFASGGNPVWAGILRKRLVGFGPDVHELRGSFDQWLLHASRTYPAEAYSVLPGAVTGFSSDKLFLRYLAVDKVRWADDFSAYAGANYTVTGSAWTSTTDDGESAVTTNATLGAETILLVNQAMATSDSMTELSGRAQVNLAAVTNDHNGGVGITVRAGASILNFTIIFKWTGTLWQVWGRLTGDVTITTTNPLFSGVIMPFDFQLTLVRFGPNNTGNGPTGANTNSFFKFLVNGVQVTDFDTASVVGSGYTLAAGAQEGAYAIGPTSGTGSIDAYAHTLTQTYRDYTVFGSGSVEIGARLIDIQGLPSQSSHLDLLTAAATNESKYWRYTPKALVAAGGQLGTLDFKTLPGTDLSDGTVTFDSGEGGNIIGALNESNDDAFSSVVRAVSIKSGDSGGLMIFRNVAAMNSYGVVDDLVPQLPVTDFGMLRHNSTAIAKSRAAVNSAKVLRVRRDPDTVGRYRPLDKVLVSCREINLSRQTVLLLGRRYIEGAGYEELAVDQYGESGGIVMLEKRDLVAHRGILASFASRY